MANTVTHPVTFAEVETLAPELAALLPDDAPEFAAPGYIAEFLGLTTPTVLYAIRVGRIRALAVPGARGTTATWAVRPTDAVRLWGHKILRRRAQAQAAN